MGLPAPPSIGGAEHRLSTVEYCLARDTVAGALITEAVVFFSPPGVGHLVPAAVDATARTAAGCYTLEVPPLDAHGYSLLLILTGPASPTTVGVILSNVRSTWVPVTP